MYKTLILLGLLVAIGSCQRGAHRIYMDDSDHPTVDQSQKGGHDASSVSLRVITDTFSLLGTTPKEKSIQTSSATSSPSSSDVGSVLMQVSPGQGNEAIEGTKSMNFIVQEATDVQAAPKYSLEDHEDWFYDFANAVRGTKKLSEDVKSILAKGEQCKYLQKSVAWDDDGYTPLHYAAEKGNLEVVTKLVQDYQVPVDIETGQYKRTPLHLAAQEGCLAVVRFLMGQEAQWEKHDKEGANTLHYAASGKEGDANVGVIKHLVEIKNVDPATTKIKEFNLLYLAIKVNNRELARYLLAEYPNLATDMYKKKISPLEFARATGKRTIADIIEKAVEKAS